MKIFKKIYLFLILTAISFFSCNAIAEIYCPQAVKCTYDAGCAVTEPVGYKDIMYFNFPSDFKEGDYSFRQAFAYDDEVSKGCGLYGTGTNTADLILMQASDLHALLSNKNWIRNTKLGYVCLSNASDCPFTNHNN